MNRDEAESLIATSAQSDLAGLFRARVCERPNHPAVVEQGRMLTYRELDERSDQAAHYLLAAGLTAGDRFAVLARNCSDYPVLQLAAAKTGVILAALNWRLGTRELGHCIALVEPRLVFVQSDLRDSLDLALGEAVDCRLNIVTLGPQWNATLAEQPPAYHLASTAVQPIDGEAGLVILYTSGTTGMPKGALISHRAMIARAAAFTIDLHLPPASNFIAWAPYYHMASTDHALATLLQGGTVFVVDGYQPDELIDLIEANTVGWFVLMPGMIAEFAAACVARKVTPKGITVCGAMADLVPRPDLAAVTSALNTPYLNSFGATETGLPPASANTVAIGDATTPLSKRQSSLIEVRLVDPQDSNVAVGEPGEVAVRGPTVFSGYWNAPDTNAQDFRGGWFHMGDVMRRHADGSLTYVDRVKYMIKSGGENIYPAEIEQVLLRDDRIREAIVVRLPDDRWGEVPIVFIVTTEPMTQDNVIDLCRDLSSFKRPKQVHFIAEDAVPRSTTGKIQRHELEALLKAQ